MNLYLVEDKNDEFTVFVAATSYMDAITRWKRAQVEDEVPEEPSRISLPSVQERVNEFMLIEDPRAVHLIAEADEFILFPEQRLTCG